MRKRCISLHASRKRGGGVHAPREAELLEHVAAEDLPREYGGTCDQPLGESRPV